MHPRGAGERIRGSVIRTFPLFCASLPFLSSLSLSLSLSLTLALFLLHYLCLSLFLSFFPCSTRYSSLHVRSYVHRCAPRFPLPIFLATFFPRSSLCSLLLKHLRWTGVRVSFFRKLLQLLEPRGNPLMNFMPVASFLRWPITFGDLISLGLVACLFAGLELFGETRHFGNTFYPSSSLICFNNPEPLFSFRDPFRSTFETENHLVIRGIPNLLRTFVYVCIERGAILA